MAVTVVVPLLTRDLWDPSSLPTVAPQVTPWIGIVRSLTQFSSCGFTHWLLSKGRTLFHIFAVPPEKAANNNRSLSGNHHLIIFSHSFLQICFISLIRWIYLLIGYSWPIKTFLYNSWVYTSDFLRFSPLYPVLSTTVPQDSFSRLKPSTLKQLGQTVTTTTAMQVNTLNSKQMPQNTDLLLTFSGFL